MPACGSEGACLEGLWSSKSVGGGGGGGGSCLGSAPRARPRRHRRRLLLGALYGLLAPALWFSAWLWIGWFLARLPLAALRLVRRLASSASSASSAGCVLVGGGSSVQAVLLARQLALAGLRVLVCELEGCPPGLARFSRACARYYRLPRPGRGGATAADYVTGLKAIVARERVRLYVPLCGGAAGYLDALAKPHLELLGCACFSPGPRDLARLEDPLELVRRAREAGLARPRHRRAPSLAEAAGLYAAGRLRGRHYALPAGPAGLRERGPELRLPASLPELHRLLESQRRQPEAGWLLLRDPGGPHFLTCTALRGSRLLANVTCRVDEARGSLVAEDRPEVERWLERFCARGLAGPGALTGHLSFRLAAPEGRPQELVALGCRAGLGPAYLGLAPAQAQLHARMLWDGALPRPRPSLPSAGGPLDQRQALFLYWDPLPYCLYCCLQLPFRRLAGILGAQHAQHKPPLAVVH